MRKKAWRKSWSSKDSGGIGVRGEAVVILMAAMMIGGFLFWMIAGHHHGMHGGSREGADSRPAAVVAPDPGGPHGEGIGKELSASPSAEALESGRGVR